MYYTTWGSVRGDCGHVHKTAESAEKCIEKDNSGCHKQGGYSDRRIREIESRADLLNYDTTKGPGKPTLAGLVEII